jgi:hypothetical protein
VAEVTERLASALLENWDGVSRREAELVADCLVRLAISHAALPGGPPARTAADVASVLGPYVDSLVAQARG